jgi:fibronectin type 3 domain-containing protein
MKRRYHAILTVLIFSLMATSAFAYDITLAWDPNTEIDLAGYNLYVRVDNSLSYSFFDELTLDEVDPDNPQFMATDMENNVTYDFVVTAVNNAGEESDFSNEVSVMNGEIIKEEVIIDNVSTVAGQAYTGNSSGSGGGCFILTANGFR